MMPLNAEKYNIAWFKLAEFVSRGEKERALGIYRLLSHSLTDTALSHQLEGDILLSFRDHKAVEAYKRAAQLYESQQKFNQAIGMYEHLALLTPQSIEYITKLVYLYHFINNILKVEKLLERVTELCASPHDITLFLDRLALLNQEASCYARQILEKK